MKIIQKSIKMLALAMLAGAGFTACENEDYLTITAIAPSDAVQFTNSMADNYVLSAETANNVAERFVWNNPDFGAQTPVNYTLEGSTSSTFDVIDFSSGTISTNNQAVTVRNLLTMAETLGLDTDPATTNDNGEPNNEGEVYFRVHAFVGDFDAANGVASTSQTMAMKISLLEDEGEGSGIEIASWGVVGSATANGWDGPDQPFYTTSQSNVFVAYVSLVAGEMKFRENNDWANNLGDTGADGTVEANGDNIVVSEAGDYKITLDLNANTYTIEEFSLGIVGSAYNDWGNAGPDAKMMYDYTSNTFRVGVKLMDGEMKIRLNNDWGTNYGDTGADGIADLNGDNIVVTEGYYLVALNMETLELTIEETQLYGVIGSGYNDWGNAGPDFLMTPMSDGTWIGQNVTLIDGEIKFRVNEDWATNYGDTGADGVLELNGDNIAVTAGTYNITLNFSDPSAPTYTLN